MSSFSLTRIGCVSSIWFFTAKSVDYIIAFHARREQTLSASWFSLFRLCSFPLIFLILLLLIISNFWFLAEFFMTWLLNQDSRRYPRFFYWIRVVYLSIEFKIIWWVRCLITHVPVVFHVVYLEKDISKYLFSYYLFFCCWRINYYYYFESMKEKTNP